MKKLASILVLLTVSSSFAMADPVADFIACDTNKDGLLQKAEYQAFIKRRAAAGNASAKWVVTFGAWGRAMSTVDTNKDGQISGDELRAFDTKS